MEGSSLIVQRDGADGRCRLFSSVDERQVGPVYRKGSLGYALEQQRAMSKTPLDVVQFLSRSWSSSSLQAFQMISHSLECELELKLADECENKQGRDCKIKGASDSGNGHFTEWMQRSMQRLRQSLVDMINTSQAMHWMRVKLLGSCKNDERKEELRLQAAMSVAGVAAAIAALSAKSAVGNASDKKKLAIATAAALVAAQCAEAAELMGAHHQQVTSIVSSAVSVATPTDIIALTAAAATSLRGATRGRSRVPSEKGPQTPSTPYTHTSKESDFIRNKEILSRGTELPTCINNGKTQLKTVHVSAKQSLVILRVTSKHLGGAFTTSKNYTITDVANESTEGRDGTCMTNEVNGYCFIRIVTHRGDVHITFKDNEVCSLWAATISRFLFLSKQAESSSLSHATTSQFPYV